MGFIEEGRQLIQDFVAPEIRAIEVRIDAVEKKINQLEARMDKRFDAVDAKMERNQNQLMDTLRRMEMQNQILERLARLESKMQNVA
jgi:tetrahydromethanopterin S-methyltransferase subunit G